MSQSQAEADAAQKLIEQYRASGIRLDRQGQFWHEGQPITHERLRLALFSWIHQLADGRYILTLDAVRYCYLEVEDAPFLVTSLSCSDQENPASPIWLSFNATAPEQLNPQSLKLQRPGALYTRATQRSLLARFLPAPYYALLLRATPLDQDRFQLKIGSESVILSDNL